MQEGEWTKNPKRKTTFVDQGMLHKQPTPQLARLWFDRAVAFVLAPKMN